MPHQVEYNFDELTVSVNDVVLEDTYFFGSVVLEEDGDPSEFYVKSIMLNGGRNGFTEITKQSDTWLWNAICTALYSDDSIREFWAEQISELEAA
ncbi:MAG: hypothetical protein ACTHJQ_01510 [Rhizobiaceae bacterium]